MIETATKRPPAPVAAGVSTRNRRRDWLLLVGLALVLLAAVVFQVLPTPAARVVVRTTQLADYFPRAIGGWTGEDRPLGDTEAVSKRVLDLLQYDEAFQRVYRKGGHEFVLYVAYWHPGKMPARDIAFHVPDVCWVGVGWKRTAADFHWQTTFEGRPLAPAQYREFDAPGDHEHVWFWHILDGRAIFYSTDGPPSQWTTLKSVFRRGLNQRGEQYFIRISSQIAPDVLWQDEGFKAVMELVAPLGPGLSPEQARY